jgi:methyl-accepting chemotaxis protein
LAQPIEQRKQIIFYLSASAVGLLVLAVLLGSTIARALSRGINTLHQISGSMVSAAGQFSNSSQVVAQGSSEQAAALEETSASLEEIAAMTQRTSENANSGKALSKEARSSADVGLNWITQMSQTLVGIRSAVMEMESSVREMQGSSQEVANIINTIDEIAFQTNLLALNAAVEAARAGEAGMGFAVVADEVRALAQRSAQAAKETSQKIDSSLRLSEQSGTASGKVVKSLIEVESTAGNLQQVFEGIVKQITSLDDIINEMAGACGEQSTGIAQVNMSITQLDTVTQGNAAIAEENAGVASELNTHIQSLKGVVGDLQVVVTGKGTFSGATEVAMGSKVASPGKVSTAKTLTFPSIGSKQSGGPVKAPLTIPMPGDSGSAKNAELIARSFKDF